MGSLYRFECVDSYCTAVGLKKQLSIRENRGYEVYRLRYTHKSTERSDAEAFFSNLKKERIKRKIYPSREEARADAFDYVEIFYNRTRRHSHIGMKSPYGLELVSKAWR